MEHRNVSATGNNGHQKFQIPKIQTILLENLASIIIILNIWTYLYMGSIQLPIQATVFLKGWYLLRTLNTKIFCRNIWLQSTKYRIQGAALSFDTGRHLYYQLFPTYPTFSLLYRNFQFQKNFMTHLGRPWKSQLASSGYVQ